MKVLDRTERLALADAIERWKARGKRGERQEVGDLLK